MRGHRCAGGSALHLPAVQDDALVGTYVGRYRILRLLGKGGMGRVYLAEQPDIGSRVAIKVLSDDVADSPEIVERLFREARTVNVIRHEQLVNIIDLDRMPNGRPFIVMEYIAGCSLREVVNAGEAPLGGVIHVMIEILLALDAAHRAGVIHRDLKPDNVMLTPAGRVKVLDFGIAKSLGDTRLRTRTGSSFGTPQYMAPEQVLGGAVDARSDVYAAGIMLFELATGQRPFEGASDFQLMEAQLRQPPPRARDLRGTIPEALEAAIATALHKAPAERFQSARAMATALHQAATALPESEWRPLGVALASASVSLQALPSIDTATPTQRASLTAETRRASNEHVEPLAGRLDRRTQTMAPAVPEPAHEPASSPRMADEPTVSARPSAKPLADQPAASSPRRRRALALILASVGSIAVVTVIALLARPRDDRASVDAPAETAQLDAPRLAVAPDAPLADTHSDPDAEPEDAWAGFTHARPPDARAPADAAVVARDAAPADSRVAIASDAAVADAAPRGEPPKSSWDGGKTHWADYAATRFDASAYLARAQQLARELAPGAILSEMSVPWVYPDGHVVLGFSENPAFEFHAPGSKPCIVIVFPGRETVSANPRDTACKRGAGAPRCTVAQILARAKAMGAPVDPIAGGGYGPRNFVTWDGRWTVAISNKSGTGVFREQFDDGC